MAISVHNITKKYGEQYALRDVSFEVADNEVVGFLGPNGAGKSTMMKILTCYLPPGEGTATVNGFDIAANSIGVRQSIGYLPEHNPLYLDMYVREFLEFTGGLYKIKNLRKRVDEMIEVTGLTVERNKKIGALSKGYRQRVGLAQAMIHDPKVLIMDEPTTGLDPNQLEEIRNLIRSLGSAKTVMLSTHIMQEVEAICDRVIIINKGQIVANDVTSNLRHASTRQIITVEFDRAAEKDSLAKIQGVNAVRILHGNTWEIISLSAEDIRKEIFNYAVANSLGVLTLSRQEQKIEDVFRQLTRR
jgi:ABC-2 type transport system ATP-binding protein